MRWNTQDKWIISKKIVHTPLIDDGTFTHTQQLLHRRAHTGAAHPVHHPRNVYLREKWITQPLDDWLTTVFQPHRLDDTIDLMAAAAQPESHPSSTAAETARAVITDCDAKLATHRAALEAGADPTVITQWIAETQATHTRAEADLRTATHDAHDHRMTRDEIACLVRSLSELATVIRQADPRRQLPPTQPPAHLHPRPPDHPRRDRPHAARPQQRQIPTVSEKPWGFGLCPRGDLNPHAR
ncbi:hypothetical protein ACFVFQ_19125 [Streptomyces sp. NPDC057743]|uniref:hypothetical protein n=1 Tax=Streptomyces sp. NPDC057743 TaxID=3346236 RepID=UPI00368DB2B9